MTTKQLQESFEYCKSHDDPEAWLALSVAYLEAGYPLNAAYCLKQAERGEYAGYLA